MPTVPRDRDHVTLDLGGNPVRLTNLRKPFWPQLGITKGDLLRYYLEVSPWLLPHLAGRAMVMKRYPSGWQGKFFFMKNAPTPRPDWVRTCPIEHESGSVIEFPVVDDVATLAWLINLGCIDLNPWYARCDDVDRPDFLHFDLDPGSAPFVAVVECAQVLGETLRGMGMGPYVKTSGSKGLHVYVPIVRGPTQKQVWSASKLVAQTLSAAHPDLMTAEYTVARRPPGRVLVDYNQNAWGRTLASIYSVRPNARACVSTPVRWEELRPTASRRRGQGVTIEDFRIDNVPARLRRLGDLWADVAPHGGGRFDLGRYV